MGGVGGVGWGGGTRGERAMSKPQGDHIHREATTARCLKTGGRTTVQGRRVAGVAVMNKILGHCLFRRLFFGS